MELITKVSRPAIGYTHERDAAEDSPTSGNLFLLTGEWTTEVFRLNTEHWSFLIHKNACLLSLRSFWIDRKRGRVKATLSSVHEVFCFFA